MSLTDPTYLRYIVDGLHSQSIQQENLAVLPQGLIGIYEEALPWEQNIQERGRFLQFFSAWALLKKEVSATLVSSLLNWPEQEVIDALATHTKWFNSPASGTYILYHERLRTYLLSKITSNQLKQTNQKIIESCQHALELKKGDEWEIYALEHLASHLLIPAIQVEEQGASFRKLVYDTSYWNRQLEISKGFDWSKKMLNLALGWAAKQGTDELIECALNKIDLHYMEQNDAPRIVELVAQNDIETALQRIESFGGNEKEGLQRKFTLYMLCLMELTLLDSKDKSFRKTAIEKLLNHLDENIPVDHSLLNWNDFFPSYLMFQMACEWAEIGLDYLRVYKRTDEWEINWVTEKSDFSRSQLEVLIDCTKLISRDLVRINGLKEIAIVFTKQDYLDEALEFTQILDRETDRNSALSAICTVLVQKKKLLEALKCVRIINHLNDRIELLLLISIEYFKLNENEKAYMLMKKAMDYTIKINSLSYKCHILKEIYIELSKKIKELESFLTLQELINYARNIENQKYKCEALIKISSILRNQKEIQISESLILESIEIASKMVVESEKIDTLNCISVELFNQGSLNKAELILRKSFDLAKLLNDNKNKDFAFKNISSSLAKQEKIEEALSCARIITGIEDKSSALLSISSELLHQGKINESEFILLEGLDTALRIRYPFGFGRGSSAKYISVELAKISRIKEAFSISNNIDNTKQLRKEIIFITKELVKHSDLHKILNYARNINNQKITNSILNSISDELAKKEDIKFAGSLIKESLEYMSVKTSSHWKSWILKEVSAGLNKQNKTKESASVVIKALEYIYEISDERVKSDALMNISYELIKNYRVEEIIEFIFSLKINEYKSKAFISLSKYLINEGFHVESKFALNNALHYANEVDSKTGRCKLLIKISNQFYEQAMFEESKTIFQEVINIVNNLENGNLNSIYLENISYELAYHGKIEEAFMCIKGLKKINSQSKVLRIIATELAKKNQFTEAIKYIDSITDLSEKSSALIIISGELKKHNNLDEAKIMFDEALKLIQNLENGLYKNRALMLISGELAKQGLVEKSFEFANFIIDESNRSLVFKDISIEFAKHGKISTAEKAGMSISQITVRYDCWKKLAHYHSDAFGVKYSYYISKQFYSQEAQAVFLNGWAESITVDDISDELAHLAVQALQHDSTSLEYFLQVYAQHELFFGNPSQEKIDRLNKTLNLQWAIDIKESFVAE